MAEARDVHEIMSLIIELANYEKLPLEVTLSEEQLLKDGFKNNPSFEAIVAEKDSILIGMAVYYYSYSTWKGRSIYLDDLIVKATYRLNGVGTVLMNQVIEVAKEQKVAKLHWQVLDWNEPAIKFYKKYNSQLHPTWFNCSLSKENIQAMSTVSKIV